ncbi:hypothetical protein LL033_23130 [Clostridium estertheticum]|nr:hypothetical protein LL033_23130 [Clostridium estertheticum]
MLKTITTHNIPMTMLGAGILWFGFNARSALAINSAGENGLIYGNIKLVGIQLIVIVVIIAYSAIMTFIILKVISIFMSLRVTSEEEMEGLDVSLHGEEAYGGIDI